MKILWILVFSTFVSACLAMPTVMDYLLSDQSKIDSIHILSSKKLQFEGFKDLPFDGISDLAWDEKQQILYAISDRAALFHLKLNYQDKKIHNVSVIAAYPLKNKQGDILVSNNADAEGLDLSYNEKGETILHVSFEQTPRIAQYTPTGEWLKKIPLPKSLSQIKYYRSSNKALESVVLHPRHGLLTATEYPLKQYDMQQQRIYSYSGKEWIIPASDAKNSAITALSVLPNQNVLILERAWAGFLHPLVITLSEVNINNCAPNTICSVKKIAKLSTADSWRLDNFEGLTHFKKDLYFMVSDNNAQPIQSTLLVLFEIQKEAYQDSSKDEFY
jgi:hypothetical protein